ncbi:MAG: hypothetical protein H6747_12630 [Deltaproteobacteria bacterium]|nr:hypothetical protein [Deltaproteobacteria bacterium]
MSETKNIVPISAPGAALQAPAMPEAGLGQDQRDGDRAAEHRQVVLQAQRHADADRWISSMA